MAKTILCKILIVDDDGIERELAGASRPLAHELTLRENGRRILELVAEQLPPEKSTDHGGAR